MNLLITALTNLEMTGHSLSFLTDGYETSSGVLAFALYAVSITKNITLFS